jgi:hypothetical protein
LLSPEAVAVAATAPSNKEEKMALLQIMAIPETDL